MRKKFITVLLIFIVFFGFAGVSLSDCGGCCSRHGGVWCVNGITKCRDGTSISDTCRTKGCSACSSNTSTGDSSTDDSSVTIYYESTTIRLYGIDCPELDQNYGYDAKAFTSERILGKNVEIVPIDIDRYYRTVAIVSINGSCLNQELLANGLAWVYDDYCERPGCVEWRGIESDARSNNLGLWTAPNPTPPWEWRQSTVLRDSLYEEAFDAEETWNDTVTEVIDGDTIKVGREGYSSLNSSVMMGTEIDNGSGCFIMTF